MDKAKAGAKPRSPKQLANDERMREMARARAGKTGNTGDRDRERSHASRAQEQRDSVRVREAEDTPWVRGGSLTAPPARPGYSQRWIRVAQKSGKEDPTNVSRKFREGWKARPADTVPSDYREATINHGRFAGCIVVEGMLLCEIPVARTKARKQYIRDQIDKKTKAIDADLKRANETNRGPGFGEIQKSARTIPVREVRVQQEEEGEEA